MIIDAKKHYPEKYSEEMSDLDILADIQHNGGATCLVDFSKNILTALWFACSSDFNADGFVYCYNIMEDIIVKDSLSSINQHEEKRSISSLLAQTYRETNISSDTDTRFLLWEPSPHNNRILRQDSVFILGIERFYVNKHPIQVVKIPSKNKRKILMAMDTLFNINEKTIYNDSVGYSNTNSKSKPFHEIVNNPFERGYVDMIKGNYSSALEFLKLYEGNSYKNGVLSLPEKLDLHYSLAVCYKKLKRQNGDIIYVENALLEYKKVITLAKKIINARVLTPNIVEYFITKCIRAYNGTIDILYSTGKFHEGIDVCNKLIVEINNGILNNKFISNHFNISNKKVLKSKYCRIVKMELLDLIILSEMNSNTHTIPDSIVREMDTFYREANLENDLSNFDRILIEYYKLIFDICLKNEVSHRDTTRMINLRNQYIVSNKGEEYKGYVIWNFKEIKSAIDKLDNIKFHTQKLYLQYATAHVISYRDFFEVQCYRSVEES